MVFKNYKMVLLAMLLICILVISGCMEGTEEEVKIDKEEKSQVVIGLYGKPTGKFNPNIYETFQDRYVNTLIFAGLMRYDPDDDYKLVPDLAKSMDISDDTQTITFELRDDVYFHDGVNLTAEDVKFTMEWMCHPDYTGALAGYFNSIVGFKEFYGGETNDLSGIEILDKYSIKINLNVVDVNTISMIATWGISPKHVYGASEIADLELGNPAISNPIGAGPFKFVRYVEDQYIEMEAYDDFHLGSPSLDKMIINFSEPDLIQVGLIVGDIDIALVMPNITDFELYESHDLDVRIVQGIPYNYLGFLLNHPILKDKQIRYAINYALDRQAMVDSLLDGLGVVQKGPIAYASWANDPNIKSFSFDPEKANQLLEEAGWELADDGYRYRDNERLTFALSYPIGDEARMQNALVIQDLLSNVGIEIILDSKDMSSLIPQLMTREYDMYLLSWNLGMDPDPSVEWLSTSRANFVGFNHPDNDRLIIAGKSTMDRSERFAIYSEWQRLVVEEAPYVWLYSQQQAWVTNPRIANFRPDSYGVFWDVWDWEIVSE